MLLLFLTLSLTTAEKYPKCLIRRGECLDGNEAPLKEGIKPQINHNIIGESIANVTSADECAEECFDHPECR